MLRDGDEAVPRRQRAWPAGTLARRGRRPRRFTARTASQSAALVSSMRALRPAMPALLTTTRGVPRRASTAAAAIATSASTPTSARAHQRPHPARSASRPSPAVSPRSAEQRHVEPAPRELQRGGASDPAPAPVTTASAMRAIGARESRASTEAGASAERPRGHPRRCNGSPRRGARAGGAATSPSCSSSWRAAT